jgi:superfamily II DNA/RNA helicase
MNKNMEEMLQRISVSQLNDMQLNAIETIGQNDETILLSPTGSGKTLAFLLPLIDGLKEDCGQMQAVILSPARELALQIESVMRSLASGHRVMCCYGGHPFDVEQRSLMQNPPEVLVATPGRLVEHIEEHSLSLDNAQWLVLDEFDKSLEMGFTEEMKFIVESMPALRKKVLTSATEAVTIPDFVNLIQPVRLNFLSEKGIAGLSLMKVASPDKDKLDTLLRLLCTIGDGQSIIFCNYRESVDRVADYLRGSKVTCETFHGGMEQPDRERALCMFRNGTIRILISTDLAARGLDIPEVGNIIHYHLPSTGEAFTHRNGRTARMNASGKAYVILSADEKIPDYLKAKMPEMRLNPNAPLPPPSVWQTLYIGKGKRDKISKGDVVGFLCQKGGLKKEELGIVEVKERYALAAVKAKRMQPLLKAICNEKIKGLKTIFEVARV